MKGRMLVGPIAMCFGVLLMALGGGLYALAEVKSVTALIPSFFGIALFLLGLIAVKVEKARMHVMHVAALLGLLGGVFPLVRAVPALLDGKTSLPVIGQILMAALCLAFLALCVKSFIDARRRRKESEGAAAP